MKHNSANSRPHTADTTKRRERHGPIAPLVAVAAAALAVAACSSPQTAGAEQAPSSAPSASAQPTPSESSMAEAPKPVKQHIVNEGDQNWAGVRATGKGLQEVRFRITAPEVDCSTVKGRSSILFWGGLAVSAVAQNVQTQSLIIQAGVEASCSSQYARPRYHIWTEEHVSGTQFNEVPTSRFSVHAGDTTAFDVRAQNGIATYTMQHVSKQGKAIGPAFNPFPQYPQRYSPAAGAFNEVDFIAERTEMQPNQDGACPAGTLAFSSNCREPAPAWRNPATFSDMSFATSSGKTVTLRQSPNLELIDMVDNASGSVLVHPVLRHHESSISIAGQVA